MGPATIHRMRTAVVSDLHLGALSGSDVARHGEPLEALREALGRADRIVLLGDVLELRERPPAPLLEVARPVFERLADATAGKRLTILPGNHDHAMAEPWLARTRLAGRALGPENEWPVPPDDAHGPAGVIASWLAGTEVTLAYPGFWPRSDVYATHGHYLDVHLTVPRIESIAASAMGRLTGRGDSCASADDFEAVLAPLYGFFDGLSQGGSASALERGGRVSRSVWSRANGDRSVGGLLLGRVTIPAAVAALNWLRIGPFSPILTGPELRRAGLLAMAGVADALAPDARHVLFGHTHRAGPLPGDDEHEWTTLTGSRLWNTGNWFLERAFVSEGEDSNPYWPGTVIWLEDEEAPAIENAMRGVRSA
jgi:Calcineurin-like phosphoesterase